jgi:Tfp pilus assembly protein PilV
MENKNSQSGFSYIDVMIGMMILMVGVLALVGAIAANKVRSYNIDKQIVAKQIALSSMESIYAARDVARDDGLDGWESVGNVGSNMVDDVPQGVFVIGWAPIREDFGQDGVAGTSDDACAAGTACQQANGTTLSSPEVIGFERKIEITDVPTPTSQKIIKRKIDITIRYKVNTGNHLEEKITTLIGYYSN